MTAAPATRSDVVSPTDLRGAMGRFATGVTVITARDGAGAPVGTTASAVSSVSLDPPLVLVCLDRGSNTLASVRERGSFAVNVLGDHHEGVSNAFARSANHAAWEDVDHVTRTTGSPVIDDAHVALDCEVESIADGGDHQIVIGRVVDLAHGADDAAPLLYYGGKYVALAGPDESQRRDAEARAEAEAQAVACDLPTAEGQFRIVGHERSDTGDLTVALVHGDPATQPRPIVHRHAACLLGDVFGSLACDCAGRLRAAEDEILAAGAGVLLYTKAADGGSLTCAAGATIDEAVAQGLLAHLGVEEHAVPGRRPGLRPARTEPDEATDLEHERRAA